MAVRKKSWLILTGDTGFQEKTMADKRKHFISGKKYFKPGVNTGCQEPILIVKRK